VASFPLPLPLSLSLSFSLSHTLSLYLNQIGAIKVVNQRCDLFQSPSLPRTCSFSLSLSLSLSLSHSLSTKSSWGDQGSASAIWSLSLPPSLTISPSLSHSLYLNPIRAIKVVNQRFRKHHSDDVVDVVVIHGNARVPTVLTCVCVYKYIHVCRYVYIYMCVYIYIPFQWCCRWCRHARECVSSHCSYKCIHIYIYICI